MMKNFKIQLNFNNFKIPRNFKDIKIPYNFNNFKVPYIIYPIIIGIMVGWLFSVIIGSFFYDAKPLPVAKKTQEFKKVSTDELSKKSIETNLFNLSLTPVVESSSETTDSNGNQISDGATPPTPPFNAKLIGILKDANGINSIAIIVVDSNTFSIKVGNEKNGIKLISLEDFSAVVERDRKQYTINLEKSATVVSSVKMRNQSNTTSQNNTQISTNGSNININVKREDVQNELKDLNKILQSALVSPYYEGGEFKGYRVARMKDDSPLKKIGLQTGDMIARINGNDLKSPEILFNMLSQIDDIDAISVDMIRNNEKKTLFVEIQ